jgi:hypothetical protein
MKMTEEKCREVLSDATMRLYGLKTLGIGIGIWTLSLLISYLINDTISSWIFWGVGIITLLLIILVTISFSPNNISTVIRIPTIQRKIIHEVARRNNLLLLIHTEILRSGKDEVIVHGLPSYLMTLRHRYSDFFAISDTSKAMVYPKDPMHYANYWFTIKRYLEKSNELRRDLMCMGMADDAPMEEIHVFILKKKAKLDYNDWFTLGNIAIYKMELERYEKEMKESVTEGEKLQKELSEKIEEFSAETLVA